MLQGLIFGANEISLQRDLVKLWVLDHEKTREFDMKRDLLFGVLFTVGACNEKF